MNLEVFPMIEIGSPSTILIVGLGWLSCFAELVSFLFQDGGMAVDVDRSYVFITLRELVRLAKLSLHS